MQQLVYPSKINGRLQAPASKSVAQRAIAMAAMATGESVIDHPGSSDDVKAAIHVCRQLGARLEERNRSLVIRGGIIAPNEPLHCGESGLGIRMFSGIAASLDKEVTLTGTGSLLSRPMDMIEATLTAAGVICRTSNGKLPLRIKGPLLGGQAHIDGSKSSQALTGLLMAAPTARHDSVLHVTDLKSREYIDITIRVMRHFDVLVENTGYTTFSVQGKQTYRPAHMVVEGDWSGAAFLLVAGAVGGHIRVENLEEGSSQPDRKIIDALRAAGAIVNQNSDQVETIRDTLRGFHFDATHCPDLFPPLAALAANCTGRSTITGVSRLRNKESDRAATLMDTFGKLGIEVFIEEDAMVIDGGQIQGGAVDSFGDHRIAMAGAVAALNANTKVMINQAEAINKSYPEFFNDLRSCQVF